MTTPKLNWPINWRGREYGKGPWMAETTNGQGFCTREGWVLWKNESGSACAYDLWSDGAKVMFQDELELRCWLTANRYLQE